MKTVNLLTVTEVASALRTSRQTIYRLLDVGALIGFRVGNQWRIHPASVDHYLSATNVD